MSSINMNLVSLKCLLFIFFGGLGCLLPGIALAGYKLGLHTDELYWVSVIAPCVALLGPLVAAPLADRLGVPSQGSSARYGRCMRALLVLVTLLGALFYTALLYVPQVSRQHERNPPVSFLCSPDGAVVMQDQCQEVPCYNWPSDNVSIYIVLLLLALPLQVYLGVAHPSPVKSVSRRGTLFLSSCRYVCGEGSLSPMSLFSTQAPPNRTSEEYYGEDSQEGKSLESGKDYRVPEMTANMPRLCVDQNGQSVCHIYTVYSKQFPINVTLAPSTHLKDTTEWCSYKILDNIKCKDRPSSTAKQTENCTVVCDLDDPYNHSESLLIESECRHTFGDPQITFWSYLLVRSLADIFPTTALALLSSCLIVAARETPALLCRQLVYAAIGFAFFPPVVEFIVDALPSDSLLDIHTHSYGYYIIMFSFLSLISSIILLFDRSLPLSPVDYHVHLGPGHMSLRGTGGEVGALSLVLVLLGLLSTAIDSYIPWESVVLALIPSLLVLWNSEKVVNYCGHSNILIVAFTLYIIRYTGLLICEDVLALFLFGALEVFTLVLSWSTAVLYSRHLVPHHFLVTGQALAVTAFLCIGRCLGSVVGSLLVEHIKSSMTPKWNNYSSENLYKTGAVLAAITASLYFVLYHFCLKHKWRKQSVRTSQPVPQDTNANGTYTPLKIYNQPTKDQRIRY